VLVFFFSLFDISQLIQASQIRNAKPLLIGNLNSFTILNTVRRKEDRCEGDDDKRANKIRLDLKRARRDTIKTLKDAEDDVGHAGMKDDHSCREKLQ